METKTNREGNMNYRVNIIDRLNRAAIAAQNDGRWEAADTYLSIAGRYETLWASLDEVRG